MKICLCALAAIAVLPVIADEPGDANLEPVRLAAVSESEGLATFEKVALEIQASRVVLEKADTVTVAGYEGVLVIASAGCGVTTFTDNSFLTDPGKAPYDSDGKPIETAGLTDIPKDSPTSLLAWFALKPGTAVVALE